MFKYHKIYQSSLSSVHEVHTLDHKLDRVVNRDKGFFRTWACQLVDAFKVLWHLMFEHLLVISNFTDICSRCLADQCKTHHHELWDLVECLTLIKASLALAPCLSLSDSPLRLMITWLMLGTCSQSGPAWPGRARWIWATWTGSTPS